MVKNSFSIFSKKIKSFFESEFIRKNKIFILIVLLLSLIFVGIHLFKNDSIDIIEKDLNLIAIYEENKPILIKKNNKYGYISSDGELLIEPQYEFGTEFFNDYAVISTNRENKEYEIINKSGKVVLGIQSDNEPKYYNECGIWLIDNKLYNKDLDVIFEGNYKLEYINYGYFSFLDNEKSESGIVDYTGKKVFMWNQEYITVDISKNDFKTGDYYAIVSNFEEIEQIVSLKNGRTVYIVDDPKNNYLRQEDGNIFRLISRENSYKTIKWLYFKEETLLYETDDLIYHISVEDYQNDILKIDYGQNYKDLKFKNRYSFYDIKEKTYLKEYHQKVIMTPLLKNKFKYEVTTENELYGLKINDKVWLENIYDDIKFLDVDLHRYLYENKNLEYVFLEEDGITILYNLKKKKAVHEFESTSIINNPLSSFLTITEYDENGYSKKNYLIYNVLTNKTLELDKEVDILIGSNYIMASGGSEISYYNTDLMEIYREKID